MNNQESLERLLETLHKRPRALLELLLKNGKASTYELGELGYDQAPRVAQDLKEAGVKLEVKYDKHPVTNRKMAVYYLATDQTANFQKGGRISFPKAFRIKLTAKFQSKCVLCNSVYTPRLLQIDHKIPFIIAGDKIELEINDFQLLCPSHQRLKSWECENCPNRITKDLSVCNGCYWASPDKYTHAATEPNRILSLNFSEVNDSAILEKLVNYAEANNISVEAAAKMVLDSSLC